MRKDRAAEFGDFQTPDALARDVCRLLAESGAAPAALLEPTCGRGAFLLAALDQFKNFKTCLGVDVNPSYIAEAEAAVKPRPDRSRVSLALANFFAVDWKKLIAGLPEPHLIFGNLPWVTNSHLSSLGSQNLPYKTNFQNRSGLDAITGKANFDISEWMLINLIEAMNGRHGMLAMLCKSAVARKVLFHGWKHGIAFERAAIYPIEADRHFDAAVDAALLIAHFAPGRHDRFAKVYNSLHDRAAEVIIGYDDGMLLADIAAYHQWKHLCGAEVLKWRSGIKHDCAKVMELFREGSHYRNGMGALVELEDEFVFPMMKSSHVAKGGVGAANRFMLVTQRRTGDDTATIETRAPKTWAYLNAHAAFLAKRGSSIYRDRPAFSIFGVGTYSFAPWKVAISGFYKKIEFTVLGPVNNGRPIVLDDTSYFLPCQTKEQAEYLGAILNSSAAQSFFAAFVFWDAKRPITADLLRRLDLRRLADELKSRAKLCTLFGENHHAQVIDGRNQIDQIGLFDGPQPHV